MAIQAKQSQTGSKRLENVSYPENAPCPHCGGCKVEVTNARSIGWAEDRGFLAWSRDREVSLLLRWLVGIPVWTSVVILYLCLLFIAFAFMIWMACTIILIEVGGKLFSATASLPDAVFHTWHEEYRTLDAKCQLCGYTWTWRSDEPMPIGQVDSGLITAGAARLEQEQSDAERRQAEAAHWNYWHNPDNPWHNPANTSNSD